MLDKLLTLSFAVGLLAASIRLAAPILYAALGEIITEQAGILNLGLEGTMLMGALGGFIGTLYTGNLWLGVLSGMLAGIIMGLVMAFMVVTVGANQVVAGIGVTILGTGLSTLLFREIVGIHRLPPTIQPFPDLSFPVLSELSVLGPVLFRHNILVYISFLLVIVTSIILFKTTFGLKVRAVGENPAAADTRGINVYYIRYLSLAIGGALAGIGGAFLSLGYLNTFLPQMTSGRGFIAIAVVIFSRWNPYRALGAALLFGGADALQLGLQAMGVPIRSEILLALPYLLTILVLIGVSRRAEFPSAFTLPYRRGGE
ncbi:MAG: ABC transporter permease [Chloroflexi bacterium]|nr:ABC transporter permease [Chloroflexota bacterium]MCL5076469.1 ABC transporter permease [Chloroflexota bacterium]